MSKDALEYTQQVYNTLILHGFSANIDNSGDNFNKKIRNAMVEGYYYVGVIGK